jgi:hypothetical protein
MDASWDANRTVLNQGQERASAYASWQLSKIEKNYGISDKEGLAVIFAIKL